MSLVNIYACSANLNHICCPLIERYRVRSATTDQLSEMQLVVDKFNTEGQWLDTYKTTVTLKQLDEFKHSFYPDKCLDLFEKLSGKYLPRRNRKYAFVIRLEDEVPENTHFIRHMVTGG
jgi:hypothetical protein